MCQCGNVVMSDGVHRVTIIFPATRGRAGGGQVQIGAAERTVELWQALLEAGLYVNIVLPPGCPPDACLLRTSYSAAHTSEHIDRALAIFERVGRELSVIEAAA